MLDRPVLLSTSSTEKPNSTSSDLDCPLYQALDTSLVPWPGMKHACIRLLELYGKVFDQTELCQLIVRYLFY